MKGSRTVLRGRERSNAPLLPDPAQVAVALAAKITFNTGLISDQTLLVRQEGVKKTVVEYRKGQLTGIFLDGSETPLRVPLPPLVMIRVTTEGKGASYSVYAVKRRPATFEAKLYQTPLPNVFNSGSVCWGTVQRVSEEALGGTSLAEDWDQLLGSPFGNHATSGKSKSNRADIRQKLIELEAARAKRYPTADLVDAKKTLAEVLR